ncbi:MAG TPA: YgiQ family radical SAM protein, partial [Thermotogota bacterium]|nr:YgiQ family radical SAM protein [Thermotogota bacterium]
MDVLLLTGDAYVDHPAYGIAIVARHLQAMGFSVGILSHTDINEASLLSFGRPRLFVGITSGNLDSMVSNYTASQKKRRTDDLSFTDSETKRPDRAVIVYTNLVKRIWKDIPIVLGGIEASLRRFAHYDWWQDKVRHSILLDSKADFIFFGMAEKTLTEAAEHFSYPDWRERVARVSGVAYTLTNRQKLPLEALRLPSFEEISSSKEAYSEAFRLFYEETDPIRGKILYQTDGTRAVVQNLPSLPLQTSELDKIYGYPYSRDLPAFYQR